MQRLRRGKTHHGYVSRVSRTASCVCTGLLLAAALPVLVTADTFDGQVLLTTTADGASVVPPSSAPTDASALVILQANVRRNDSGDVVKARLLPTVILQNVPGQAFTSISIHEALAGENGPVALELELASPSMQSTLGANKFLSEANELAALGRLLANPAGFYINVVSEASTEGYLRGQFAPKEDVRLGAVLRPSGLVPPLELDAVGQAGVRVQLYPEQAFVQFLGISLFGLAGSGKGVATTVTGFELRQGAEGEDGALVLDSGTAPVASNVNGLAVVVTNVAVTDQDTLDQLAQLLATPTDFHLVVLTAENPNGALRGQAQAAEHIRFDVAGTPMNLVPPLTGVDSFGLVRLDFFVTRDETGEIESATQFHAAVMDVDRDHTGLFLAVYRGGAGEVGERVIAVPPALRTQVRSRFGQSGPLTIGPFSDGPAFPDRLEAIRDLVADPDNFYFQMHSNEFPDGFLRGQVSNVAEALPFVPEGAIVNAAPTFDLIAPAAPRGLTTIFGVNLANVSMSVPLNDANELQEHVNGTGVWIGGIPAKLLFISPGQLNVQIPDLVPGTHSVQVKGPGGIALSRSLDVGEFAPGIFVITKLDFTVVSESNPIAPDEIIIVWMTGLGASNPPVAAGALAQADPLSIPVATPTVTYDGNPVAIVGIALAPNLAGAEQVAVQGGVELSGEVGVVVNQGGVDSNRMPIFIAEP